MIPVAQFDRLSPNAFVWHRYDSAMKAELFATALATASGVWLIDPFAVAMPPLIEALGRLPISGIIVTNENHIRASADFAAEFQVSIHASGETRGAFQPNVIVETTDGARLSDDLSVISLEGAAAGEIALHFADETGTLVVGDALINFGEHGFTFLPAKYCANAKLMRKSLRKLLDYRFERILFAHGMPIVSHGRRRLEALLAG